MNHRATVVACADGILTLRAASASLGCLTCLRGGGCSALAFLSPRTAPILEIPSKMTLPPGASVSIVLDQRSFRRATYWSYGLPAVALLGVSVLVDSLGGGDGAVALGAITAGLVALAVTRMFAHKPAIQIVRSES